MNKPFKSNDEMNSLIATALNAEWITAISFEALACIWIPHSTNACPPVVACFQVMSTPAKKKTTAHFYLDKCTSCVSSFISPNQIKEIHKF
jgi:hypothetical protein